MYVKLNLTLKLAACAELVKAAKLFAVFAVNKTAVCESAPTCIPAAPAVVEALSNTATPNCVKFPVLSDEKGKLHCIEPVAVPSELNCIFTLAVTKLPIFTYSPTCIAYPNPDASPLIDKAGVKVPSS